jgi:Fibronectin type III domain
MVRIALGVLVLAIAWIGFQLGTHRHTGILRTMAEAKHFLERTSISPGPQKGQPSPPGGPKHSVNLSWKASTSPVVGYNVYRRGTSGQIKLNSEPVTGTTYVDSTVQSGQTYFYAIKAVNAKGTESTTSNEVRADVPSP